MTYHCSIDKTRKNVAQTSKVLEHYRDELEGMVAVLHLVQTVGMVPDLKGGLLRPAYYSYRSESYPCQESGKAPSLALVEAQVYQTEISVFHISTQKREFLKNGTYSLWFSGCHGCRGYRFSLCTFNRLEFFYSI